MNASARYRRRDESDLVLLQLVRLVVTPAWDQSLVIRAVVAGGHSRAALRLALARLTSVTEPPGGEGVERAIATLRATLAAMDRDSGVEVTRAAASHQVTDIGRDAPR